MLAVKELVVFLISENYKHTFQSLFLIYKIYYMDGDTINSTQQPAGLTFEGELPKGASENTPKTCGVSYR